MLKKIGVERSNYVGKDTVGANILNFVSLLAGFSIR